MTEIVTLSNGIRIAMQEMPHVRSVSIGVWINTGSVRESKQESGSAHFIEHMVFKGTKRRSAEQIAAEMDAVGGNLNAFTSKECTCFYARVLDENLPLAVDMLSDIVLHSQLDPEELEKEKKVVVEEILMTEDNPEDLTSEKANELFFDGEPLARPILGTQDTVNSFTRESLMDYMDRHYGNANIVVACAGRFSRDKLLGLVEEKFNAASRGEAAKPMEQAVPGGNRAAYVPKDVEQVHITLMTPGFALNSKGQFALAVLSNAMGGSMSSRLFQKIREQRGLAYSVYSYPISYTAAGTLGLYAGTGAAQCAQVLELMLQEMDEIRDHGITKEEFQRCKQQMKCSYLMGMESTGAVMNAIGKTALLQNREYIEAEMLERMECVTMSDIEEILPVALDRSSLSAAFVGRVKPYEKALRELLKF